jgi:1-pyrroline-5-carboxylate dehydrogenase
MKHGIFKVPAPINEPVYSYAPGTKERELLQATLKKVTSNVVDIPMYIGGKEVRTDKIETLSPPHNHKHIIGKYHKGNAEHVKQAIDAALAARKQWADTPFEFRASIFLKAADLIATKYRYELNAATMEGQSKSAYQAEIDSAAEIIDFLRFNVSYAEQIYSDQPVSSPGVWNRLEYRPLEGFVFALTPFNFTAIAGNLPSSAALMGNVVVWKPSNKQIYSANVLMKIFMEAGVPDGVINLIYTGGKETGDVIFSHPEFAGIHFTGSTGVFQDIWKSIGNNIHKYKSYPRIVGETGGKDFIVAHPSADAKAVATAISRGAFEYQGQKCSAASRCYIPSNLWEEIKGYVIEDLKSFKMGEVSDFSNFINAVIDEVSFDNLAAYIDRAKQNPDNEIIAGGNYNKSVGYFIEPTIIVTKNPKYETMCEELFGPVLTIYVYEPENWSETLDLVDNTSPYALTGAIFSQDRYAVLEATERLNQAAGNFYINDKPTGAVVGQQPFGGARASGTNDKAGSYLNLIRWVSARTIKETFNPPHDYRYPFLG